MWRRQGLPEEITDIYRDYCVTDLVLSDLELTPNVKSFCYSCSGDQNIEGLNRVHTETWGARI